MVPITTERESYNEVCSLLYLDRKTFFTISVINLTDGIVGIRIYIIRIDVPIHELIIIISYPVYPKSPRYKTLLY